VPPVLHPSKLQAIVPPVIPDGDDSVIIPEQAPYPVITLPPSVIPPGNSVGLQVDHGLLVDIVIVLGEDPQQEPLVQLLPPPAPTPTWFEENGEELLNITFVSTCSVQYDPLKV